MKNSQVTLLDWTNEVEKRLKGQTVEDLSRTHLSGLICKVLYTSRPEQPTRISKSLGWNNIRISGEPTALVGVHPNQSFIQPVETSDVLRVTEMNKAIDIQFEGRIQPLSWAGEIPNVGTLHYDAWASQVISGVEISPQDILTIVKQQRERPITIDTTGLAMCGATPVDELAWILGSLAEHNELGHLVSMDNVWIQTSLDTLLFENVAKCRALRRMLEQFSLGLGLTGTPYIHGETTLKMFTLIDPHVNLLRATISAIAGIWGGVDGLSIHPYDVLDGASKHSLRVSDNMHRVLSEESGLGHWMDPLEGSYAVENWTEEFCSMGWNVFASDESKGGLITHIGDGTWNKRLAIGQAAREQAIESGHLSMTGTTKFSNAEEVVNSDWLLQTSTSLARRDSEAIERMRLQVQLKQTPTVKILCLKTLSSIKRQIDLVEQFMATMGWTVELVYDINDGAESDVLALCGLDESNQDVCSSAVLTTVPCVLSVGLKLSDYPNVLPLTKSHPSLERWNEILNRLSL